MKICGISVPSFFMFIAISFLHKNISSHSVIDHLIHCFTFPQLRFFHKVSTVFPSNFRLNFSLAFFLCSFFTNFCTKFSTTFRNPIEILVLQSLLPSIRNSSLAYHFVLFFVIRLVFTKAPEQLTVTASRWCLSLLARFPHTPTLLI